MGVEVAVQSTPVALAATDVTGGSCIANWNAVANAADYRLDVYTKAGSEGKQTIISLPEYTDLPTGNVTSFSVEGLNSMTVYYSCIRAFNSNEISDKSNEIKGTTGAAGCADQRREGAEGTAASVS